MSSAPTTSSLMSSHGNSSMSTSNSLSRADAVAITAVVGGLCSFTAGLLLGVQTERPPVYKDVQPEMKADIELQHNEAYGQINQ